MLVGTDAANEGLNLQTLSTLINLDLPWNPTRLEQRKGRIQRIGQLSPKVKIFNMRYKDSVEDKVHTVLSERLKNIHQKKLFIIFTISEQKFKLASTSCKKYVLTL